MAAVTSPETSPQPRVYFQTPAGTTEEPEMPVRKQGRVTVKYDRKELRKRLNLEEWIIDQLTDLYDCEEEAIPELEIDVDELLDMPSDVERAARVKVRHAYTHRCWDAARSKDQKHHSMFCHSRTCWWTVLNPLRTSSQSCWTRSEECRSSPHHRRNDGICLCPPAFLI
uniref:Protein phosphatase 1 regulatory inhibitor subunit 14B n=1 Tax=Nothobranchius furzeri TaxID=105023 RepID=A0A8C6LVG0_NOTFU